MAGVLVIDVEWTEDLPNQILRCDDAGGYSVSEGVELDGLVGLQVFLSQEDVEVGKLLH